MLELTNFNIFINIYINVDRNDLQYLTEVSTPLTFLQIFYYIFSCDNIEEICKFAVPSK